MQGSERWSRERLGMFPQKSWNLEVIDPACCSFLTWFSHDFSGGQFFLPAVSLWWQRHDILDFSCCPLSRVLHVTLVNVQKFGFEFYLGLSPSAFSGWSVDQPITLLLATPCWRNPTRSKQLYTVTTLGSQLGLYHVVVPLSFKRSISLASLLRFWILNSRN